MCYKSRRCVVCEDAHQFVEIHDTFMCHGLKRCWICENSPQGNGRHTYCPLHSSFVCPNLLNDQKNGVKIAQSHNINLQIKFC